MTTLSKLSKFEPTQLQIRPVSFLTDSELINSKGKKFIFDIEIFPNFFLAAFQCYETKKIVHCEQSPDNVLNLGKLAWMMENLTLIGFNNKRYDEPMIWAAIAGFGVDGLYNVSNKLIYSEIPAYKIERELGYRAGFCNTIDLMEVAPSAGIASLKHYAARMNHPTLQDLPFSPSKALTQTEAAIVRAYSTNDLDATSSLYSRLDKAIDLRERMGIEYEIDLRSKSDAQISESVIKHEIASATGSVPKVPHFKVGTKFYYQSPNWVKFYTDELQKMFATIRSVEFTINENGSVVLPKEVQNLVIELRGNSYRMGIGGLHSCEQRKTYVSDENQMIIDRDVASYYPSIILNNKFFPEHIGPAFLDVYGEIVKSRLEAKKRKDKTTADSLKITINGAFGKLGSPYSCLYSPHLMIQVTITGQLALLMLIEMLEWCNFKVVSANTDGIVFLCDRLRYEDAKTVISQWEKFTSFETEETRYSSYHAKDVNNYIAIGEDGAIKAKGDYVNCLSMKEANRESLMKNPNAAICSEAVMLLLRDKIPISETITKCKDFTKFLIVRKVKGGAIKDGHKIGKIIRWYMKKDDFGKIRYAENGNMVPDSMGGYPVQNLPKEMPKDIDFKWYIDYALQMLTDLGWSNSEQQMLLF